ncbi:serine/threonine protein kinase [Streptomyces sp. NBC_01788]|uniref:serine/threonine-protein kinase n=1 Tax=Streptomyces sp. NBC_01788 TaxID=2975940 RepID=UPI002DDBCB94|nr:serine/threonine-protein kinase [Streptomyces sp. NBC_01788]WSB28279.1 serine/threonine protein kinase [Streptomyces sp. NBC_01788]
MSDAERAGTPRQDTRQDSLQDRSERLLAGRYRLGDVLGRGGMGTVWRAEDETLGRTVAVKELRFPSNIDEDEKRRLITRTLREAKAIARIRDTSAVTVFDVVDEDDRPWIVMELVEGKSLAEAIREDGLLTPRRAAEVGLAVLDVLRSAHGQGILHRDVKPSNVLIAEDGRVVLTDFGIAQVEGDPSITSTGMLVGAPSYISPERARGHKPGPAADLWSLGGLLYASVEGTPPYDKGSAIATLTAVMTEPLEEPRNAGPLRDVIHGLLNKDPDERLDDAGARAMLKAVIDAPEPKHSEPEPPADATKVVPLPAQPDRRSRKGGSGSSGSGSAGGQDEEPGDRLRGALRSVRKASVVAKPAAAAGAGAESASGGTAPAGPGSASGSGAQPGADRTQSASASGSGAGGAQAGRSGSGWPVMTPPDLDLPPRPAPKASLTDVVPRRTLVIVAVVVVLAVAGAVLALTLGGDDKGDDGKSAADRPAATAGSSAGPSTKKDESGEAATGQDGSGSATEADGSGGTPATDDDADAGTSGKGSDAGSGSDSDSDSDSGSGGDRSGDDGAPVAMTYKGAQGFSIGLPKGWKYASTDSAGVRFTGPDGQRLLVAWTTTPKGDPVADWTNQERYMVRSQYQRVRIEAVDYRGWNTADWEFTYVEGGTKYRSIDRGFVVNDHLGHALMYSAKAATWDGDLRKSTWKTLTETFQPKK